MVVALAGSFPSITLVAFFHSAFYFLFCFYVHQAVFALVNLGHFSLAALWVTFILFSLGKSIHVITVLEV